LAVRELGTVPLDSLHDLVPALIHELPRDDEPRRRTLVAATLLHVDHAILCHAEAREVAGYQHSKWAWNYVLTIDEMSAPGPALLSFARRFYLLQGLLGFARLDGTEAETFFEEGLKRFPRDGSLLYALGALEECRGQVQGMRDQVKSPPGTGVPGAREYLVRAERIYRRLLDQQPEHELARTRLGRVLQLQGRKGDAEAALDAVAGSGRDPEALYLARLFRGRLYEETARLPRAADDYRAALQLVPTAQAAHLGLAHVLEVLGERAAAQASLEAALASTAGQEAVSEGWWTYLYGHSHRALALMDELRRELAP
jgi:tetratricopeptide (TPR) repeat protein